jgi:hypothetical protein
MKRWFLPAMLVLVVALAACAEAEPQPETSTDLGTVSGHVLSGPNCPVVTDQSPCPDEPMAGETVELRSGDAVVATTTSDADGAFTFEVRPGTYELVWVPGGDPGIRTAKPVTVTVDTGETVTADLFVDTGIR